MRIGGLRIAALAASVALGMAAGAAAAYVVSDEPTGELASDPLGIGADLVNQGCTGESILVVGRGSNVPGLRSAVVENAGEAKYLDTDASCPTLYAPLELPVPEYVVYVGPFDDRGDVCGRRMSVEHKGDFVTRLQAGNQTYVKCPCELSADTWPVLTPGMTPDALEGMWVRQLQGMLVDTNRLRDDVDETGVYDARTVEVVKRVQRFESLPATGVVDAQTWDIVRDRACRTYDY